VRLVVAAERDIHQDVLQRQRVMTMMMRVWE